MIVVAQTAKGELKIAKDVYGYYTVYVNGVLRQHSLSPDSLAKYMVHILEGMHDVITRV